MLERTLHDSEHLMGPKRSLAPGKGAAESSGGIESVDDVESTHAGNPEPHADSLPAPPGDAGSDPDRITPGGSGGIE
jgi:hypothetical protein